MVFEGLLKKEIKRLEEKARNHRIDANNIDYKIRTIKKNLSKICKHENTKIITNSYEEPGKVKYHEWKEEICIKCGKTVATGSIENSIKWTKNH